MRHLVLIVFTLLLSLPCSLLWAQSQEVVEATIEATSSKKDRTAARQEVFDKAIHEASTRYIQEIVGEQKLKKNASLIENKIIKQSGKYVLFMKGGEMRSSPEGIQMAVQMKLSLDALKTLLLNEGLLYQMDGPPKLLPVVSLIDRVNSRSYSWWSEPGTKEKSFLEDQLKGVHSQLRGDLRQKGFFGLEPVAGHYYLLVPTVFRSENPPTEDYLFLSDFFKSQVVVKGHYLLSQMKDRSDVYRIDIKLTALQSGNGRVVAEVIRTYETESGGFDHVVAAKLKEVNEKVSKDLTVQLHEAWKSGTFGSNLLRLAVKGSLNYQELAALKKEILAQVKDVKTLKERLFEPGQVVFEVDTSGGAHQLAQSIRQKQFTQFKVNVEDVDAGGVNLEVSKL